jgi:long-chain fatty acid transport protein
VKSNLLFLIVTLLLISTNAFAGGFQLNEHGAKALAMGGAFTAIANDPSAVYWNGAGLSQFSGTHLMLGTSLIAPQSSFRGVYPDITKYRGMNLVFFPTHFFGTHSFNEKFSVGFGFTTPFGLGTEWDIDWVGRYLAVKTQLMTFTLSPIVTYAPVKQIAISAGFVYSFAHVVIERKVQPSTILANDAYVSLEGNDNAAFGFNAGLMIKPTSFLTIGASYHSEVKYGFTGTATSTGPAQLQSQLPSGDISAELTTPQNIAVGIAVDITKDLKVSADYQMVGWSSYDKLEVTFEETGTKSTSPRLYDDSYIIRFGADYRLNKQVSLMGGVYFDKNPVSTKYLNPSLPESDRLGLSCGIEGRLFDNFTITGSYLFIRAKQLTVSDSKEIYSGLGSTFNGTYNSSANIFSLGFVYSF